MKHSILGAGGVGGLIGAVLARAGEKVTLAVRPGTENKYPQRLTLESKLGNVTASVTIATRADAFDVLWLTVKATQLDEALREVLLPKGSVIVPLLNGIDHVAALRARFGKDAVIPATIAVESERTAPGHIVHRSPFCRLNVASSGKARLDPAIDHLRQFGFDCKYVDDEATLMWGKLAMLAPIALSTTSIQAPIGDVLSDPKRTALLESCVREACAVGIAAGASLDPDAIIRTIRGVLPSMRSSMQKDLAAGNPLELDAIGGPILRGGKQFGVAVPATDELLNTVAEAARTS
jgi:2-dehydropantoate 2-reductase